jgi:hypothetical protein
MQDFPSPSRAPWLSAYEGMISWRGVAKKRRAQDLAGMTVKSSVSVAAKQQSWRGGNHRFAYNPQRVRQATLPSGCGSAFPRRDAPEALTEFGPSS